MAKASHCGRNRVRYSIKFYPGFNGEHQRVRVLQYIASLEEAAHTGSSPLHSDIAMAFNHAERIAVSAYAGLELGNGLIDFHFHRAGQADRFYYVGALYELKDGGVISILRHRNVSF